MLLPDDDSIVLPDVDDGAFVIDRNEPPAATQADLDSLVPAVFRSFASPPRDAMLQTWGAGSNAAYASSVRALDKRLSPRFADGDDVDEWGDIYGRKRAPQESTPDYRARLLQPFDVITPDAIQAVVRALVAEITTFPPAFLEPTVDALFLCNATASDPVIKNSNNDPASSTYDATQANTLPDWSGYWSGLGERLWADDPDSINPTSGAYIIKLYGFRTPTVNQFAERLTNPQWFSLFWIVIPGNAGDDSDGPCFMPLSADDDDDTDYLEGISGETTLHQTNIDPASPTDYTGGFYPARAESLLDRINSEVERRRACGTAWIAFYDSDLPGAV